MNTLTLLDDLAGRSDRQLKQTARAASDVRGAPLGHTQWLHALRRGDLDAVRSAYALPARPDGPRQHTPAWWQHDLATKRAVAVARATDVAVAGALGLDSFDGTAVAYLRVGSAQLAVTGTFADVVRDHPDAAARLVADVPGWLAQLVDATASAMVRDDQVVVWLTRPVGSDVHDVAAMVDRATDVADVDRSDLTVVQDRWTGAFDAPDAFTTCRAAVALARLDATVPAGWETYLELESPGNGWPYAIDEDAGVGVAIATADTAPLTAVVEDLVDELDPDDPPGLCTDSRGRRGQHRRTVVLDDLPDAPTVGQLAGALRDLAVAAAG